MKREGLAILLISSDVEEIVQLVNRVCNEKWAICFSYGKRTTECE